MADYRDIYRTPLLSAKALGKGTIEGVIESINLELIKDPSGKESNRLVIEMNEGDTRIALNKTNAVQLAELWGNDYTTWQGKKVKVTTHKTEYMGRACDGLHVMPIGKK